MKRTTQALSLVWLLAGCAAVGPDYHKPALEVPVSWQEEWRSAAPSDGLSKGAWWEIFEDAELNRLEQQALSRNQSLKASIARLEQARALTRISRASYLPTLEVGVNATRTQPSANRPNNARNASVSTNIQTNLNPVFSAAYEVDLFGRISREVESSSASQQQIAADLENIKLILAADIAANYFNLCAQNAEIEALAQIIAIQKGTVELIHFRQETGVASKLDSLQQESLLNSTQAQHNLLTSQRDQTRHALATLTGVPVSEFTIADRQLPASIPSVPLDLPAYILERRPDVASAERAVAAANAQIGVATAARFPNLRLTASRGWQSSELNNLLDAPSIVWSLGLALSQTIFDGNRNRARVDFAKAGHELAAANYRQTVLLALQEVEDGLSIDKALADAAENNLAAEHASTQAVDIIEHQYKNGLATSFELFIARKVQLENRRLVQQITGQQLINTVYLIKTLGGGWQGNLPSVNAKDSSAPSFNSM
ncbi:efflux transporter outer membrane subunit [Methylobacillus gramineus]|uniref:efflux transporter outer membrane subunit n=1 Tax=Methylobacillus gramineus TaxID=755169 RepID=UPI001CFFA09F|nr:efflux transporter outer membrane subunit [Methylobacillus gramineus]MCB5183599.1 efflux transporter outer membrane subunit [Methylobacillus gramineus]